MSTYSESLGFSYNGIHSSEFGILNVHTDSGLFEEQFLPERTIVEEKTFGRHEPYFFGFDYSPSSVPLKFYFDEGWDDKKIQQVAMWLTQPVYKPLVFDTDKSRIFHCVYEGDPRILHNGLKEGYVNISFRSNSPFSYTPVYSEDAYVETESNIEIANIGHDISLPTIEIQKIGNGDVSILNYSNGGIESKIVGLLDQEIVKIDGYNEEITTNQSNTNRYNNFNNKFPKLVTGVNRLKITGSCNIRFTYQFKRFI